MAGILKKIFSFGFGGKKAGQTDAGEVINKPAVEVETKELEVSPEPELPNVKAAAKSKGKNKSASKARKSEKADSGKPVTQRSNNKKSVKKKPTDKKTQPVITGADDGGADDSGEDDLVANRETPHDHRPKGKVTLGQSGPPPSIEVVEQDASGKPGWFNRLREGLARSSTQLSENVTSIFIKRKLDDDTLLELEDVLIQADLGVDTAMRITQSLADQRHGKDVSNEEVRAIMAQEIEKTLEPVAKPLELDLSHQPHVILVVGVNGSGKTTTIGKLTAKLNQAGLSTLLVAGDTFRAAAIEQLKIWGERTNTAVISRDLGSDAASLAYDAYQQAQQSGVDVMLMDTAGRLQNKTELMAELSKIIRVLKKHDKDAPHTVLLTLDATTGQNALNQVEVFGRIAGVNGLVMTKLDGTARGGILVAISAKYKLPVYFLGVGEQVDDLEPFEARDFARSIAGFNE